MYCIPLLDKIRLKGWIIKGHRMNIEIFPYEVGEIFIFVMLSINCWNI